MPSPNENEEILQLLHEIDEFGEDLTEWELEFISDLIDKDVRSFTDKQAKMIRKIHRARVG